MCLLTRLFLMALTGTALWLSGFTEPPQPREALLSLVSDPLLVRVFYRHPERLASNIAASGAVGENARWEQGTASRWYVELQRYGGDFVQAGIVSRDADLVRRGWQMLDWGFAQQQPDGSFGNTGDPFHSASLFVEGAARALLLAKQSDAKDREALETRYGAKLVAAARWLMKPDIAVRGQRFNQPYTHRRWLLAAALGEAAELSGDREMAACAERYARDGLALQTEEGIYPEKGGGDVAYQAFGILLACRYYTVCKDAELRLQMVAAIRRGLQWELKSVDAEGRISTEGSTRTGKETARSGKPKTTNYKEITQAFALGAVVTGEAEFRLAAERIAKGRGWITHGPASDGR